MITNISLTTIWTTDQDASRDFYVDVLGFVVTTDVLMGDGFRWLTIAHPDHPELEASLMLPGPPLSREMADAVRRALADGTLGGLGLATDDCRKTYDELVAKGVEFTQPPADRPYGVEAVMRDNTGNWLVVVEQHAYDGGDFAH